MGRIPTRLRDQILVESDFTCCICGQKIFCDVHHLTPLSEGGKNCKENLIVLCPSDHRLVHHGAVSNEQLIKLWNNHIEKVRKLVASKNHLIKLQDLQISNFTQMIREVTDYPRASYQNHEKSELYFIGTNINNADLVVDPFDNNRPILVCEKDLIYLPSLESVSNPFRFIFLEIIHKEEGNNQYDYKLIRYDVVDAITGAREKDDSLMDSFKRKMQEMYLFTKQ